MNWRNWLEVVKFSVLYDTVLLYILPEIEDFLLQPPPKEIKVEQDLEIQGEMQKEVLVYSKFAPCLLLGVGKKLLLYLPS